MGAKATLGATTIWIQTSIGFFSIVEKPEDQQYNQLTIRSRIRSDLEALKLLHLPSLGKITDSRKTDYAFRAKVNRSDLAQALVNLVDCIGYSNFKNEVGAVQGKERSHVYGRVWSNLYELQLDPDRFEWNSSEAIEKMAVPAADSYGVVLLSPDGQTLLRKPSGGFGGYSWTYAKGQADDYESPKQTARRECLEETGYHCRFVGLLPQRYEGSTGATVFFVGVPVGEQEPFGPETAETRWVTVEEAHGLIQQTKNAIGRDRDQMVLCDLYRWLSARQTH